MDRRAGERAAQRHQNDERIIRRRSLVHGEIHPEGNAAKGPRQHDVHVPKSERGRPHAAECETARRGKWKREKGTAENWAIKHHWNVGFDSFGAASLRALFSDNPFLKKRNQVNIAAAREPGQKRGNELKNN